MGLKEKTEATGLMASQTQQVQAESRTVKEGGISELGMKKGKYRWARP